MYLKILGDGLFKISPFAFEPVKISLGLIEKVTNADNQRVDLEMFLTHAECIASLQACSAAMSSRMPNVWHVGVVYVLTNSAAPECACGRCVQLWDDHCEVPQCIVVVHEAFINVS